jgi:serine/threonine protein kinase/tetratricopeptide (TPR) repeat protein
MSDLLHRVATALEHRYAVDRELGRGGMAIVFLARERKHDRLVALKVLRPELTATLGPERFVREVEIAARLSHPHILPLYDSGSADGFLYFTMPYVAGDSVRERLRRERTLPMADALRITRQVASALEYAHQSGLIHRDVKPENILLQGDAALLSDFGIARAVDAAATEDITAPGLAVGTPAYMSPEQAIGDRAADGRGDVYSLGCVLYEMLAGSPPFTGGSATEVLARKAATRPTALRAISKAIPHSVDHAVARALAARPAERFRSAPEFIRAIDGMVRPTRSVGQRRAAVAVGVAALLGATGWWTFAYDRLPRSIAIIPCTITMRDTTPGYLGEIGEDLIDEASKSRLFTKVIAHSSTRRFRDSDMRPSEVGDTLGAEGILYCTYQQSGVRERLRAELVRARDGEQLWTRSFERELSLVDDVPFPRLVISTLGREVYGQEGTAAATPGSTTKNLRALQAYREGRQLLSRVDAPSIQKSIALFGEAIALDSGFALPYLGRARAHFFLGIAHGDVDEGDAFTLTRADVDKALQLDPQNADANRRRGALGSWEWAMAERNMTRSLELDPNLAQGFMQYAWLLSWSGRHREALTASRRSLELSPVDPLVWANAGVYNLLAEQYDTALVRVRKSLDLAPNYHPAHWVIGAVYAEMGRFDEAIFHLRKADSLSGHQIGFRGHLGYAYGLANDTASAHAILRELLTYAGRRHTLGKTAASLALVYIGLGQRDSAFHWMQVAADRKSFLFLSNFMLPPTWRVADDPRYAELLARIGLPGPVGVRARMRGSSVSRVRGR